MQGWSSYIHGAGFQETKGGQVNTETVGSRLVPACDNMKNVSSLNCVGYYVNL